MARPKLSAASPAATTPTAAPILQKISVKNSGRLLPYVRVAELCPPLTRGYVNGLIRAGVLRAVRYNGLLLIERASVEEFVKSFKPWTPKNGRAA